MTGIQTYIINSARVVFLKERPHPKGKNGETRRINVSNAGSGGACKNCMRTLQAENVEFCSIACKVRGGGEMTPDVESLRLLEQSMMKQHVAIPRNGKNSSKQNKDGNTEDGTSSTGKKGGGAGKSRATGKKRMYQTKVKKEDKAQNKKNSMSSSTNNNGQSQSFATPATSSLGVTPEATPNRAAAGSSRAGEGGGVNGIAAAIPGGRKLNGLVGNKRKAFETPNIVTPSVPTVPNRRKKFSMPRKSPDM